MELFSILLIISVFGVVSFTPYFNRQDILFGYRVGEGLGKSTEANSLRRRFVLISLTSLAIITVFSLLMIQNDDWKMGTITILFVVVHFLTFIYLRQAAARLLEKHKDEMVFAKKVVVSTQKKGVRISTGWFIIPVILILASAVLLYFKYDQLPQQIPMRYDLKGNITGYEAKNIKNLILLPLINFVTTGLLFYVFLTLRWVKDDLSGKNVKASWVKSEKFKRISGIILVYIAIIMNLYFFLQFLIIVQILPYRSHMNLVNFLFPVILIFPPIIIFIRMGQGGSRLKVESDKVGNTPEGEKELVKNDNQYWKLGMFYYNPEDPSVWVEKRFGIGWSLNFARPHAWFFLAGLGLLFLVLAWT